MVSCQCIILAAIHPSLLQSLNERMWRSFFVYFFLFIFPIFDAKHSTNMVIFAYIIHKHQLVKECQQRSEYRICKFSPVDSIYNTCQWIELRVTHKHNHQLHGWMLQILMFIDDYIFVLKLFLSPFFDEYVWFGIVYDIFCNNKKGIQRKCNRISLF